MYKIESSGFFLDFFAKIGGVVAENCPVLVSNWKCWRFDMYDRPEKRLENRTLFLEYHRFNILSSTKKANPSNRSG